MSQTLNAPRSIVENPKPLLWKPPGSGKKRRLVRRTLLGSLVTEMMLSNFVAKHAYFLTGG